MAWEKMWRCKKCENLNFDYQSTCAGCGKSMSEVWKESVYKCKRCGNFVHSYSWALGKCPACGKD